MAQTADILFMKRAIRLASKGFGRVNPNPMVGALVVKNNKIIGEGFHEYCGGPHAEINAMNKAGGNLKGASLYVTLEPCNHFGKTPPCTERIIAEGITKVVIGMADPNSKVTGRGAERLRSEGIEVEMGILENETLLLNEVYMKYTKSGLPFCALKTAMTLDGKISTYTGDSKWISNEKSRQFVHHLRHGYMAVMVGVNTIIKDNPALTDRSANKIKKNPARIIVDSSGRTPLTAKCLNVEEATVIIAVTDKAREEFIKAARKQKIEIIVCPEKDNKVDLKFLIRKLGEKGIDSILLEGGSTLNFSALKEGIIDKVYSFISPKMVGGEKALTPMGGQGFKNIDDAVTLNIDRIKRFDEDLLIESYLINS